MLYIFNTTIAPTPGLTYKTDAITADHARAIVAHETEITSAIGHEATAQIASAILGRAIPVNRIAAGMAVGDAAICVKLRGRAPEGVILSAAEVEAIGFDLVLMTVVGAVYVGYTPSDLAAFGLPDWAIRAAVAKAPAVSVEVRGDWVHTTMDAGDRATGYAPLDPDEMVIWERLAKLWVANFGARPHTGSMGGVSRADLADVAEALLLRPHRRQAYQHMFQG